MTPEFLENDWLKTFEAALKRNVPEEFYDYGRIESVLFKKIRGAEDEGALSLLQLDEIPPDTAMQRVEEGLAKRIDHYIEYEAPVDECIKDDRGVHGRYWRFIENKLDAKIEDVSSSPLGEQVIKADEMLSMGQWESIEQKVETAAARAAFTEPWEAVLLADEVPSLAALEKAESGLEAKLAPLSALPQWEQLLLRDEVAPPLIYDRAESALFSKIDDYETARNMVRRSVVAYFGSLAVRFAKPKAMGAVMAACLFMAGGYFAYRDHFKTIPVALYLVQGNRLDLFRTPLAQQGTIASEKDGSVTFVTKKGYVELQNGSQLKIIRASEKNVFYHTQFADADDQLIGQGSATFFVNHQKKDEHYTVATRDYRVEVTGTYFRLQPDIGGHVSVAVREGIVTIVFNNGETRSLKAGQVLAYDLNSNTYATTSDGIVVARQDIEQMPDIKDLGNYQRLSITTAPAAAIRIDGRFAGMSPLTIMQPKGVHGISIEKNAYQTLDTSVVVGASADVAIALTLKKIPIVASVRPNVLVYDEVTIVNRQKSAQPKPADAITPSKLSIAEAPYDENDFRSAERLEATQWQKAVALYRRIADNAQTPRLKREAALFSIGKLLAEHGPEKSAAKEAFLNYLALYPTGNFVGESWLRLAELEFPLDQDKAIEYYLRYFEHYPRHLRISELQHRVGLIYLQKKKYNEAIAMFKLALANYQSDNIIDKGKIQTSLYKALKEKDDSLNVQPAGASPVPKKPRRSDDRLQSLR